MQQLTQNAVARLYEDENLQNFHPWLQVIDIKQIKPTSGTGADRYRVVLSDGTSYISGMLATQLAELIESKKIQMNYIVQLKDFIGNNVQGRRIIIVLGIDQVVPCSEKIGSPQKIDSLSSSSAPQPAQQRPKTVERMNTPAMAPPVDNRYSNVVRPPANRAPVVADEPGLRISDIESLNPYPSGRWTIKARVTNRTPIKHWSNAKGEGKLFSVELVDRKGGEIRATMFKETVDKFYDLLRPGGTFYFSGGKVKMANRKFSSVNNDYEVTFDHNTTIRPAPEDPEIQQTVYNFKKIADIEKIQPETNVDLIGIVKSVSDCAELTSKAGKQLHKRDVIIVDNSNAEVKVTMWNERAQEDCTGWQNSVLAIKGCRVSDFGGRSIGTFSSTQFNINPDIPQAGALMNWYSNGGNTTQTKSLSGSAAFGGGGMGEFADRATLSDIKDKKLGYGPKPDYITVKATISFIKHDSTLWYQACVKCQKKVVPNVNQEYTCEKCQVTHDTCEHRYILPCTLQDYTGNYWSTAFNDMGKIILDGRSADEMAEIQFTNEVAFKKCFERALFSNYIFRCRVKAENVNDEVRVKAIIVAMEPLDYVKESSDLLEAISRYN